MMNTFSHDVKMIGNHTFAQIRDMYNFFLYKLISTKKHLSWQKVPMYKIVPPPLPVRSSLYVVKKPGIENWDDGKVLSISVSEISSMSKLGL